MITLSGAIFLSVTISNSLRLSKLSNGEVNKPVFGKTPNPFVLNFILSGCLKKTLNFAPDDDHKHFYQN